MKFDLNVSIKVRFIANDQGFRLKMREIKFSSKRHSPVHRQKLDFYYMSYIFADSSLIFKILLNYLTC